MSRTVTDALDDGRIVCCTTRGTGPITLADRHGWEGRSIIQASGERSPRARGSASSLCVEENMRRTLSAVGVAASLILSACGGGGGTPAPASSQAPASSAPATSGSPAPSGSPTGFDPTTVSGEITLAGWDTGNVEATTLQQVLDAFQQEYPNIKVTLEPVADYATVMITRLASGDAPDLFYVNAENAPDWIEQGVLQELSTYATERGFDTNAFYPAYLEPFTGEDGLIYGFPKDGNTIAMAHNTDLVAAAPASYDELITAAEGLKGQGNLKAPMCLNAGLDRGLAFIYLEGGSLVTPDGTASAIDSPESVAAVQKYLDLFKNDLAQTAADMGDGWCGEALGKGDAAIAFEGGWLDPFMANTYPDIQYGWAEMPAGAAGKKTISYTVSYSIGVDSDQKDAAWVLLTYLTGPEGMAKWTEGGVANPSRSDVPPAEGKEVLVAGSEYAEPGAGFIKGYPDIQKAFQDAFTAELENGTYSADTVVAATKSALDQVVGQ
jgi:multiple sugar transport system substrate-binding protein